MFRPCGHFPLQQQQTEEGNEGAGGRKEMAWEKTQRMRNTKVKKGWTEEMRNENRKSWK